MAISTSIIRLFSLSGLRASFAILLASVLVGGCGTLVCMDGPCDAVMANIYEKSVFTPNQFSQSRTAEQIADDIWACKSSGEAEQNRLVAELRSFDPYLSEYAARTARIDGVGQTVGTAAANTDVDTSGSGVRISGERSSAMERDVLGAVGSIAASVFMDDGYDPSKQPLMDLEDYLQADDTFVRFTNICLRQIGYQVDENAADGSGTVSVHPESLAVTIRRNDCMDVTMYKKTPMRDENGDFVFKGSKLVYTDTALPAPMPAADCTALAH